MSKSYLTPFLEKHRKGIQEHTFPEISGDEISVHDDKISVDFNSVNSNPLTPEECFKADESSLEVPESSALSAEDLYKKLRSLPHAMLVSILIDPNHMYPFKQVSQEGVLARYEIRGRDMEPSQEAIVINKILEELLIEGHEMSVEDDLDNQHNQQ